MPYLLILLAVPLVAVAVRGMRARRLRLLIEQEEARRDASIEGFPLDEAGNDNL